MFKEVCHIADVGLYVESTNYRDLFKEAALGLMILSDVEISNDNKIFIVNYRDSSFDKETLLVNWLNFLILQLDNNLYLLNSKIKIISNSVISKCYFRRFNKRELLIKAATFHNLQIIKYKNLIKTQIIFDV